MLRGFRWQLLAFVFAVIVFAIVLISRSDGVNQQTPSLTATSQSTLVESFTETPEIVASPEPTPQTQVIEMAPTNMIPTYREALVGSVQRLNPIFADLNSVDADISSLIFEGLTGINEFGEPELVLAQDWVVSFDGLEYVFTLRDDVLWQDGMPFTANDVVYTLSLLASPDYQGSVDVGQFWRTVEVEQLSDYMIRFRLSQPFGGFLEALRVGILPVHALEGITATQIVNHPFNLSPIGTGPYQLEGFEINNGQIEMVNLRYAPNYAQRSGAITHAIDRFTFQLHPSFDVALAGLQTGEVDGFATGDHLARQNLLTLTQEFDLYTIAEPTVGMVIFNWVNDNTQVFNDLRFRQALQQGLQRSSLVDRLFPNSAILANSPLPPNSWAYVSDIEFPAYDIANATELLSRVNFPEPELAEGEVATPTPYLYRFQILTIADPTLVNLAQEIATQWSQIGLEVQVDAVDITTYKTRLESGEFDTALIEFTTNGNADPDIYTFWHQGQYPDGQNYGGANDRTISELLERGRQDVNGTNRMVFYQEFQREFIERAIAIPLYYPLFTYLVRSNVGGVQLGFVGSPQDRFQTLANWQVNP